MRQRSPGSWELRVFLGRDSSGKRRYPSRTVRGDKAAAEEALTAMVQSLGLRPEEATVGQVLERWFEEAKRSMKASTVATTRVILDAHLLPDIEEVPLAELHTERVEALYRQLAQSGGRRGRGLSGATVRRAHSVLHRGLAQAVEWGWLKANPARAASLPDLSTRQPASVTPLVLQRLPAHAQEVDERLGLFIRLAAVTGARRAQLLALRWWDLDFSSQAVRVVKPATRAASQTSVSERRQLSLDAVTVEMLKAHKRRAEPTADACGVRLAEDAFVFSDSVDSLLSWPPSSVTQAFARLAERAGVPEVRLDDLRHFAVAHLVSTGADARSVAARVWSNVPWPSQLASEAPTDVDREAAEVLGQLLEPSSGEPALPAKA